MTRQQLLKRYDALTPSARKKVDSIINALSEKPLSKRRTSTQSIGSIVDEPFVGMWRDRDDMQDSAEWVREFRRKHWDRKRG